MIAHGLLNYVLLAIACVLTGYGLIVGQGILRPLVIAFYVWYLINALAAALRRISLGGWHPGDGLRRTLAVVLVLGGLWFLTELIINNVETMIASAPALEATLHTMVNKGMEAFGLHEPHGLQALLKNIHMSDLLSALMGAVSGIASEGVTILLYLAFLFVEQGSFRWKLSMLLGDSHRETVVWETLQRIGARIQTYIWLKTLASLLAAGLSFLVMLLVGLHDKIFWAILIFILNFIPYLGPAIGLALPSLAALVQLQTFGGLLLTAGGLVVVSFIVGNVVEPRLFGKSLNVSPLVLLLSLAIWGSLWGVVGMILCIPIMGAVLIVLDCFPRTRPLALAMSEKRRAIEQTGEARLSD